MLVEGAGGGESRREMVLRSSLFVSPFPFWVPSLAFPLQPQSPQEKQQKAGEGPSIYLLTKSRIHFDSGGGSMTEDQTYQLNTGHSPS